MCLPQDFKIVNGLPVTTSNTGAVTDWISCKNAHKVWILFECLQAATHATELGVQEGTNVAGGSANAITASMKWWKNADVSVSDTLVRQTDAATIDLDAGTTNQQVICEVDPSILDVANVHDCIKATIEDSSEASNFVTVTFFIQERYAQSTPPSAIID